MQRRGTPELAETFAQALLAARPGAEERWTHGFHPWPARMHPDLARVLCRQLVTPGMRVLDPFCGSGTVLLEAMATGAEAWGVDLHPLALRVSALRCARYQPDDIAQLQRAIDAVAAASVARVKARAATMAPLSASERSWYAPHVLRELAGLHAEIAAVPDVRLRGALELVFSAIVVKFSRQRADTAPVGVDKTIGKLVPTRFFARKGHELALRLAALAQALPADASPPTLRLGDARVLVDVVGAGAPFHRILSSPPYAGTYDYADHHARREPWLGIRTQEIRARELGARRDYTAGPRGRESLARWDDEVGTMLASMRRVLGPNGLIVLLVGDGEVAGTRIGADRQLERIAATVGLRVDAVASQPRTDWHGGAPRAEHLVGLVLADQSAMPPTSTSRKVHRRRRGS